MPVVVKEESRFNRNANETREKEDQSIREKKKRREEETQMKMSVVRRKQKKRRSNRIFRKTIQL